MRAHALLFAHSLRARGVHRHAPVSPLLIPPLSPQLTNTKARQTPFVTAKTRLWRSGRDTRMLGLGGQQTHGG